MRSGLGIRFVRELEQGKETVRMDKVNVALAMFNAYAKMACDVRQFFASRRIKQSDKKDYCR